MREASLRAVLRKVFSEHAEHIYWLTEYYNYEFTPGDFENILKDMKALRVPAREDCVRNFLAAWLRVLLDCRAKEVDEIASSSKGRLLWEKKIRELAQT